MDTFRALLNQLMDFIRRSRAGTEWEEEMEFHLEMETKANLQEGMSPAEARRRARLDFGGQDWHAERVREARGGALLEDLARDLRFGLRVIRLRPIFALAAILTLSIGVGMTTTMFTLLDAVVLRPLAGENAQGMVYLWLESGNGDMTTSPTPELLRLVRDHASSFTRVEAYATGEYSLLVDGEPLLKLGGQASTGFFSFLGVRPELGRGFLPGDGSGSGNPVVVLSHTFWAERFGETEEALGRTMVIEGRSHEIIGVLPRDFRVDAPREAMFWIPEGSAGDLFAEGAPLEGAVAALAQGVSADAASAELDAIVKNNPLARRADMEWVGKVRPPRDLIDPSLRKAILLLQAGAFVVLLIACGNLTNLLLAQGETRSRELALRASLGAGRGRLIRQLLSESMVLGGLGIAGGILLAVWALDSVPFFLPPGYAGFSLNGLVLSAAAGLALASILLAGLLPALRGAQRDLGEIIKAGGGGGSGAMKDMGTRRLLVTAEVAMAFVLLVSAGLLVRNFTTLIRADVGFPRQNLLTLRLELPPEGYPDSESHLAFLSRIREGIRTGLPGSLGSATLASGLVEDLSASIGAVVPEGENQEEGEDQVLITWNVAPDYFQVVGVPLFQGRGFLEGEGSQEEEVVIINDEIARRYFPGGDAVGRRVLLADEWYRVVGIAGSVRLPEFTGSRFGDIQVFLPLLQDPTSSLNLISRVTGDRTAAVDRLKEAVWRIDPTLPVLDVSLVEDALAESLNEERSNALLMVLFALTALTLGAVGMYGMIAYSVSRRVREIGVRMALGASSNDVVKRTVLGGMAPVLAGMVLGALGAFLLGSTLSGVLQVDPRDPTVYLVVGTLTASVAFLATWLPARRAARGSPIDALRSE